MPDVSQFRLCAGCQKGFGIINVLYCTTCERYICHLCMQNRSTCPRCNTKSFISGAKGPERPEDARIMERQLEEMGVTTRQESSEQVKAGCFVATAAYGSALAPEVLVFRHFRDECLLRSKTGSAFVEFYYLVSPSLAKVIARTPLLGLATRMFLLGPMLRLLKKKM